MGSFNAAPISALLSSPGVVRLIRIVGGTVDGENPA